MGEPEDGAAIVVFASGPSNDLIERQLIQDHVVSSGRIPKSANREDPPIRDERVGWTPSDHTFLWFERCVQEGLSIGEPLAPPCDGARSAVATRHTAPAVAGIRLHRLAHVARLAPGRDEWASPRPPGLTCHLPLASLS